MILVTGYPGTGKTALLLGMFFQRLEYRKNHQQQYKNDNQPFCFTNMEELKDFVVVNSLNFLHDSKKGDLIMIDDAYSASISTRFTNLPLLHQILLANLRGVEIVISIQDAHYLHTNLRKEITTVFPMRKMSAEQINEGGL
jgi:hypothetical protein